MCKTGPVSYTHLDVYKRQTDRRPLTIDCRVFRLWFVVCRLWSVAGGLISSGGQPSAVGRRFFHVGTSLAQWMGGAMGGRGTERVRDEDVREKPLIQAQGVVVTARVDSACSSNLVSRSRLLVTNGGGFSIPSTTSLIFIWRSLRSEIWPAAPETVRRVTRRLLSLIHI